MRDDPGFSFSAIASTLREQYDLALDGIEFLPIGHDFNAWVYRVVARDGTPYFLKIRNGAVNEPALAVPRALIEAGIPHVLAPLRTVKGGLWCAFEGTPGHTVVLYPYLEGENAMVAGMSEDQWREFGIALRAVHDSEVGDRFRHLLPTETFALPSAALVRKILAHAQSESEMRGVASSLAEFWRHQASRIEWMLERAEFLGRQLQEQPFELVLCHSDIHAANILVGLDGQIHLIDWDGPLRAPRERDMIFVIGSRIARTVQSQEERWFFEGYGRVEVDPTALSYFRYERIIEDIGEFGKSVFHDPDLSEEVRRKEMDLTIGLFEPGGDVDRAEQVVHDNRP